MREAVLVILKFETNIYKDSFSLIIMFVVPWNEQSHVCKGSML